jgi:hypothetical protein
MSPGCDCARELICGHSRLEGLPYEAMRGDVLTDVSREISAEAPLFPNGEKKRFGSHHCVAVENRILCEPDLSALKRSQSATVVEVARVDVEGNSVAVEDE